MNSALYSLENTFAKALKLFSQACAQSNLDFHILLKGCFKLWTG